MRFRDSNFLLNPRHPLSMGNQFVMLSRFWGAKTAFDSSPFGRNGTLTNMEPADDWKPAAELGRQRIVVDGSNEYVDCPAGSIVTNNCTFVSIVRASSLGPYRAAALNSSTGQGLLTTSASNVLSYLWAISSDEYNAASGLTMTAGVWYLTALRVWPDHATVTLVDLFAGASASWTNTKAHAAKTITNLYVASDRAIVAHYWAGDVSDCGFWTRQLTDAELSPSLWRDPMFGGWIRDPTRRVIPWVSGGAPPAAGNRRRRLLIAGGRR